MRLVLTIPAIAAALRLRHGDDLTTMGGDVATDGVGDSYDYDPATVVGDGDNHGSDNLTGGGDNYDSANVVGGGDNVEDKIQKDTKDMVKIERELGDVEKVMEKETNNVKVDGGKLDELLGTPLADGVEEIPKCAVHFVFSKSWCIGDEKFVRF